MPVGRRSRVWKSNCVQQPPADALAGAPASNSTLSGSTTAAAAVALHDRHDVLQEVQLLVRGGEHEVVALVDSCSRSIVAVLADHRVAALLAERRIGQHHVEALRAGSRSAHRPDAIGLSSSPMPCRYRFMAQRRTTPSTMSTPVKVCSRSSPQRLRGRCVLVLHVLVGGEQEAAGAAGRIADRLARLPGRRPRPSPGSAAAA